MNCSEKNGSPVQVSRYIFVMLFVMFADMLQKFGGFGPVFYAPVFKAPFLHVVIAFIVYVVEYAVMEDKVGGEIVYIDACGIQQRAHGLYLIDAVIRQGIF